VVRADFLVELRGFEPMAIAGLGDLELFVSSTVSARGGSSPTMRTQ
jgi:hypothetical protein